MRITSFLIAVLFLSGCSTLISSASKGTSGRIGNGSNVVIVAKVFVPMPRAVKLPDPELQITPEVEREIRYFVNDDPNFIREALDRRRHHYDSLVQIFRDEGVPDELINVALIESGFSSTARSSCGAVGMWQFMKATARVYGLKIGFFEDQRKDPILSSIAAARHLRDLFSAYRDWNLALAAYNAGPATVDRALARSQGDKMDFWSLSRARHFRAETRRYVPRFIAVSLILRDPARYGFTPTPTAERV